MNKTFYKKNNQTVKLSETPVLAYNDFYHLVNDLLQMEGNHCLNYYAYIIDNDLKFICCIADDNLQTIYLLSHELKDYLNAQSLLSLSKFQFTLKKYENKIHENFGVSFSDLL